MELHKAVCKKLDAFNDHQLGDLKKASLMDRVDTKFLIPVNKIDAFLSNIKHLCSVLSIDGRRISQYSTCYLDDSKLRFYREHHNGSLNRYKVRVRTYVEQKLSYLEVKFKNNKGRTIKNRIEVSFQESPDIDKHKLFLFDCGLQEIDQLNPTQRCDYHRIAFASERSGERLTLDFDLKFRDHLNNTEKKLDDIAIIELKQNKINRRSDLYKYIKQHRLTKTNFSKYCIGISLLKGKEVKSNRFKRTLLTLRNSDSTSTTNET